MGSEEDGLSFNYLLAEEKIEISKILIFGPFFLMKLKDKKIKKT